MKKKLKTEVIIALFRMLNEAKYAKMNDDGKIKTWRILRALKPIAVKFDDDMKTAREKLRPDGYDELLKKAQQLENDERKDFGATNTPEREQDFAKMLREKYADYAKFQDAHMEMLKLVEKAMHEYAEQEVEVKFDPLSDNDFEHLMTSNDWTMTQAGFLADNICRC